MEKHLLSSSPTHSHQQYDHYFESNPSLLTVGFPSDSKIISRNQNRANDTQPIAFNSQTDDCSLTQQSFSDTYLNLTHQDIDDVLTALHTLAQYVNFDLNSLTEQNHRQSMKIEKLISIDQQRSHSSIQILPQQILQTDSFDTQDVFVVNLESITNLQKFDTATQWSSHEFELNNDENQKLETTHSTILTELAQSKIDSLSIHKSLSTINDCWTETPKDHLSICKCSFAIENKKQRLTRTKRMKSRHKKSYYLFCLGTLKRSPYRTLKSSRKKK